MRLEKMNDGSTVGFLLEPAFYKVNQFPVILQDMNGEFV